MQVLDTKYVDLTVYAHSSAWGIGIAGEHFMGCDDDFKTEYHCFAMRLFLLFLFCYMTIKLGHKATNFSGPTNFS